MTNKINLAAGITLPAHIKTINSNVGTVASFLLVLVGSKQPTSPGGAT